MQKQDNTIVSLLANISNKDNQIRKTSEKELSELSFINPFEFIKQITMVLTNQQQYEHIRFLSGLMFTMITTKRHPQNQLTAWARIQPQERKVVQQGILEALATQNHQVRKGASNAVAKVARIALKNGQWDQLFPTLIEGMQHDKMAYKLSCILAVGKICQDTRPSSIQKNDAKQLFTVMLEQMQIDDEKLHSYGLQSVLVMIPLAGSLLETDQAFSMLLSDAIMSFINHQDLQLRLQERAWRCMNEICHFFYITLHNKHSCLIQKIFQILNSNPNDDLYQKLSIISCETLTTIIVQEFERQRRKLFSHNIIVPISQKLASELTQLLKSLSTRAEQIDELTTGPFPAVENSLEKLIQLADKSISAIIEQQIQDLFEQNATKCAGITVAACYFNCSDIQSTRMFLVKGFDIFTDLLSMDKLFIIERMAKLFQTALDSHYEVLILDQSHRQKLLKNLIKVDTQSDFQIALVKLKLLVKYATVSSNLELPANPSSVQIMETCYKIIINGNFKKTQYELPHRAAQAFAKLSCTIKQHTQQFQLLRDQIFLTMCNDISVKVQKLNQLTDSENKVLDLLFEITGQVLLTLQRIQFKHLNTLIGFVFEVFEDRKNIGSQACSLLTGLVTAGQGLEMKQVLVSMIRYIKYVLTGSPQNKVIHDVLLTVSAIAMVIRNDIYQFFSLLDPIFKILKETTEHGILFIGVQVYSDFAFYSGSLFKPHAEKFLEVLEIISKKIISYWEEKQEEGRTEVFDFDQDDKACVKLTEGLVDALHNAIIGCEQGRWKVKIVTYARPFTQFLEQVLFKMFNVLSNELLIEIGYTFVDYLRVLKEQMYPWYKEKVDFFDKFINHLINEGRRLKEKSEKVDLLPDQQIFAQLSKCGETLFEWFKKFQINIVIA